MLAGAPSQARPAPAGISGTRRTAIRQVGPVACPRATRPVSLTVCHAGASGDYGASQASSSSSSHGSFVPHPGGLVTAWSSAAASPTLSPDLVRSRREKEMERATEQDIWNRVELLRRQMQLAAQEENYPSAAALRDRATELRARLAPGTVDLLAAADRLRGGSDADRRDAAEVLGRLGDERAVPALIAALRDACRPVSQAAEKACWDVFQQSHSPAVDARLKEGVDLMLSPANFPKARDVFSEVIALAPTFAEGYNKRATVLYLMRAYHESIEDCKMTVQLQPAHFGALSGMGLCYVGLQELGTALVWFQKALAINPHMEQIRSYAQRLEQILAEGGRDAASRPGGEPRGPPPGDSERPGGDAGAAPSA